MDAQPMSYRSLTSRDEHDESSSVTDVDSVLLNEKDCEWQKGAIDFPGGRSTASPLSAKWRRHRWLLNTSLMLFNVILSALLLWTITKQQEIPSRQIGDDLMNDRPPQFDAKVVKWESDPTFVPNNTAEFFEQATVDRWKSLLPTNAHRGDSEVFSTTSMTHQLHCLFMMGRVYAGVTENRTDELPDDYHAHFLHCIDYIRQGIMCSGDVALEPHGPADSDDLGAKDGGWNGLHVCKDYGQVMEYLDEQIREGGRTVLPIDD